MIDLTELDISKARRALDAATAPAFSLADAIKEARDRFLRGELGPSNVLDPASRPREYEASKRWDVLQTAKARVAAYEVEPERKSAKPTAATPEQMTDAEIRARIAELRARGAK